MSTFYLDLVNGDDAKDGTTWAKAWKTFNNGPRVDRIAPGDLIKVAKKNGFDKEGDENKWVEHNFEDKLIVVRAKSNEGYSYHYFTTDLEKFSIFVDKVNENIIIKT